MLRNRAVTQLILDVLGGLPAPPVDLIQVASRLGVNGIRATRFRDGFTDFRCRDPVIFLNHQERGSRMRFVFAHELAHVIIRKPQAGCLLDAISQPHLLNSEDNEERLADYIAGTILVPDTWIDALRDARFTLEGLKRVAQAADVSLATLVRRMRAGRIEVSLLHWLRGDDTWHIIDRPGAPSWLSYNIELSESSIGTFDQITDKESTITINGYGTHGRVTVVGIAFRDENDLFCLIRKVGLASYADPAIEYPYPYIYRQT
jgi:IrrE N-terminal-like domain